MIRNQNMIDRLYLSKGDEDIIYLDRDNIPQNSIDGIRFLYKQFKRRRNGVILNDPNSFGRNIQICMFLKVVRPLLHRPVLILCEEQNAKDWVTRFDTWTDEKLVNDVSIETVNPHIKKMVMINPMVNLHLFCAREWSIIVVEGDKVKSPNPILKLPFRACFKIWNTSINMKTNLKRFEEVYKWLFPREIFERQYFIPDHRDPGDVVEKSIMLDSLFEDIVLRRNDESSSVESHPLAPYRKTVPQLPVTALSALGPNSSHTATSQHATKQPTFRTVGNTTIRPTGAFAKAGSYMVGDTIVTLTTAPAPAPPTPDCVFNVGDTTVTPSTVGCLFNIPDTSVTPSTAGCLFNLPDTSVTPSTAGCLFNLPDTSVTPSTAGCLFNLPDTSVTPSTAGCLFNLPDTSVTPSTAGCLFNLPDTTVTPSSAGCMFNVGQMTVAPKSADCIFTVGDTTITPPAVPVAPTPTPVPTVNISKKNKDATGTKIKRSKTRIDSETANKQFVLDEPMNILTKLLAEDPNYKEDGGFDDNKDYSCENYPLKQKKCQDDGQPQSSTDSSEAKTDKQIKLIGIDAEPDKKIKLVSMDEDSDKIIKLVCIDEEPDTTKIKLIGINEEPDEKIKLIGIDEEPDNKIKVIDIDEEPGAPPQASSNKLLEMDQLAFGIDTVICVVDDDIPAKGNTASDRKEIEPHTILTCKPVNEPSTHNPLFTVNRKCTSTVTSQTSSRCSDTERDDKNDRKILKIKSKVSNNNSEVGIIKINLDELNREMQELDTKDTLEPLAKRQKTNHSSETATCEIIKKFSENNTQTSVLSRGSTEQVANSLKRNLDERMKECEETVSKKFKGSLLDRLF